MLQKCAEFEACVLCTVAVQPTADLIELVFLTRARIPSFKMVRTLHFRRHNCALRGFSLVMSDTLLSCRTKLRFLVFRFVSFEEMGVCLNSANTYLRRILRSALSFPWVMLL
jgi:hypothetical protein